MVPITDWLTKLHSCQLPSTYWCHFFFQSNHLVFCACQYASGTCSPAGLSRLRRSFYFSPRFSLPSEAISKSRLGGSRQWCPSGWAGSRKTRKGQNLEHGESWNLCGLNCGENLQTRWVLGAFCFFCFHGVRRGGLVFFSNKSNGRLEKEVLVIESSPGFAFWVTFWIFLIALALPKSSFTEHFLFFSRLLETNPRIRSRSVEAPKVLNCWPWRHVLGLLSSSLQSAHTKPESFLGNSGNRSCTAWPDGFLKRPTVPRPRRSTSH